MADELLDEWIITCGRTLLIQTASLLVQKVRKTVGSGLMSTMSETVWLRVSDGLYSLHGLSSGHTVVIGSREEVERELQTPWEPDDVRLIATHALEDDGPVPPGSVVTHVTRTLIKEFPTAGRLRDVAGRIETVEPNGASETLAQLLRKIASALET